MSGNTDPSLSMKSVQELVQIYACAMPNERKEIEIALVEKMRSDALTNKYQGTMHVLASKGIGERVMLEALTQYSSNAGNPDLNLVIGVLKMGTTDKVKKEALDILAGKGFLHTLEEIRDKGTFRENKALAKALDSAIQKCIRICTEKGHAATLGRRGLMFATCGG